MPLLRSLSFGFTGLAVLLGLVGPDGSPPPASAGTLVQLSLDEISRRSTAVVAGTPLESTSVWEDSEGSRGQRIVTYTRVRVDQVIDGEAASEVWVRTLGGSVGDIGQRVDGEAILVPGRPGLFFLRRLADGPHGVVGMSQGHLRLDGAPGQTTARVLRPPSFANLVADPRAPGASGGDAPVGLQSLHGKTLAEAARLIRAARQAHAQ